MGRAACSRRGGRSWWYSRSTGSDGSHIPMGCPAAGRVRAGWDSAGLEGLDRAWSAGRAPSRPQSPRPHPLHGAGAHSRTHLGFCVKGDGHRRPGFRRQRLGGLDLHDPGEGSKESGERSSPAVGSGKKQGTSVRAERLALVIRTGDVSDPLWREACCSRGLPVLEFCCQEVDRLRDSILSDYPARPGRESGCRPGSQCCRCSLWPHCQLSVSDTGL